MAILSVNNMQYIVREGETIATRIALDSRDKQDVDVKLLGLIDGDSFKYGKPYLENKINFELGEMVIGEKVTTFKYKHKSRYRRKVGMRKKFIELKLNSIAS